MGKILYTNLSVFFLKISTSLIFVGKKYYFPFILIFYNYILKTYQLASSYIENLGDGSFKIVDLPEITQRSPLFDFHISDLNKDGNLDILSVGNFEASEVLSGRYDSGNGSVLLGDGKGGFKSVLNSGFNVPGEARNIQDISYKSSRKMLLVGLQNNGVQMLQQMD